MKSMLPICTVIVLVGILSPAASSPCGTCVKQKCRAAGVCPNGLVKDKCGCCNVCRKEYLHFYLKRHQRCPSGCTKFYDLRRTCFGCRCQVREPGDSVVSVYQSCPPGTHVRQRGITTKTCTPYIRIHEDRDCFGSSACPADCERTLNRAGNCYECKCSEDLEGDIIVVSKSQTCPHGTAAREIRRTNKICKSVKIVSIPESDCVSEKDGGPCYAYNEMFAFNPHTKRCERFVYGGCRGNANRYETEEQCLSACGTTSPVLIY